MSLLTLTDVYVRRERTEVVHGVTLSLERGEVVALLGPNGAGKSSLLEAIGGVLRIASGTVAVDGRVASVLQTPGLARRSVRANVHLALAWWGVPRAERGPRAMAALEQMRAGHLAGRAAYSLSGGERRRVHVARGLALQPDLLLLDEPFAGLDPETRAALAEDTASALRTVAGGVLVVVHERAEAWALANRLVVLVDGRVAADGTPAGLLQAPPSIEVARFLGYDGQVQINNEVVLTRPTHVQVVPRDDPRGHHPAVVTRVVPRQDGAMLELRTEQGTVRAVVDAGALGSVALDDTVGVRLIGGVSFPGG